jgi:hypothetical protein
MTPFAQRGSERLYPQGISRQATWTSDQSRTYGPLICRLPDSSMNREQLIERLSNLLRRHIRGTDAALTDHDFVCAVHLRYLERRGDYLIDPSE